MATGKPIINQVQKLLDFHMSLSNQIEDQVKKEKRIFPHGLLLPAVKSLPKKQKSNLVHYSFPSFFT